MDAPHPLEIGDQPWEQELARLLSELTSVQTDLLAVLEAKRESMGRTDLHGSEELRGRAEQLLARLEACQHRRAELLQTVKEQGAPAANLGSLASRATKGSRGKLVEQVKQASLRMRLLHHCSLSNWVLAQRSLLHVAQMLEIIASGGRLKPTYGNGESFSSGGALVDHSA